MILSLRRMVMTKQLECGVICLGRMGGGLAHKGLNEGLKGDSIRRHKKYLESGVHFLDIGTSGGVAVEKDGACFMLGGDTSVVTQVEPVLLKIAMAGGYVHAGPPGAGHFVKLVHNGINYGMAEAVAEGVALLESAPLNIDVAKTLEAYRYGTVIRGFFMDTVAKGYKENKGIGKIDSYVDDTGEVNWLIDDALHMEVGQKKKKRFIKIVFFVGGGGWFVLVVG